ncbi:hypothetical protein [Streptomyces sp. NPDC048659]|uniref:hypothetical protein n=1 Tax=Streptomyces sp. NPDC048659 TaxID=3155489 RepID=UPI00343F9A9E
MTRSSEGAHELAFLCKQFADVRADAREEGCSAELDAILAGLRDGSRSAAAAVAAVNALMDLATRPRGYSAFAGQEPAPPPAGSYLCPVGLCSRSEVRRAGAPLPECAAFDEPLTFG